MHVLIVDDNTDIRLALRMVLEDAGYVVSEAEEGQVALNMLMDSDEPLVVFLDHHMPIMNGPELLHYIDQHPALARHRAFIFMSAVHDPMAYVAPLLARLPISLLPKPFDIAEVLTLVSELTEGIVVPVVASEHLHFDQADGNLPR